VLDLGYRHVDVFSRRALQGNGLVVVLDTENLSTAVMQQLTREVRPFETAFLTGVDLPGRSARVRIFTEHEKLDFAGHPVLGAAAVLHTLLPAPGAEESWALAAAQRRDQDPRCGRVEDGATGSAAGPAAGYLLHHGARPAGEPLLIHQGRFAGRPSRIEVHPEPDGRLWAGGPVAPVAAGRFHANLT
jgi:predicted PhzF superfamily epimerase YddE/YHI9